MQFVALPIRTSYQHLVLLPTAVDSLSVANLMIVTVGCTFRTATLSSYPYRRFYYLDLSSLVLPPHTVVLCELLLLFVLSSDTGKPRFVCEWYPYRRTHFTFSHSGFNFLPSQLLAAAFSTSHTCISAGSAERFRSVKNFSDGKSQPV